jgi:hypothetical protein
VIDDLCWGHRGGSLFCGRNHRVHHRPHEVVDCNLNPRTGTTRPARRVNSRMAPGAEPGRTANVRGHSERLPHPGTTPDTDDRPRCAQRADPGALGRPRRDVRFARPIPRGSVGATASSMCRTRSPWAVTTRRRIRASGNARCTPAPSAIEVPVLAQATRLRILPISRARETLVACCSCLLTSDNTRAVTRDAGSLRCVTSVLTAAPNRSSSAESGRHQAPAGWRSRRCSRVRGHA